VLKSDDIAIVDRQGTSRTRGRTQKARRVQKKGNLDAGGVRSEVRDTLLAIQISGTRDAFPAQ